MHDFAKDTCKKLALVAAANEDLPNIWTSFHNWIYVLTSSLCAALPVVPRILIGRAAQFFYTRFTVGVMCAGMWDSDP